jgi:hypothetical protein
LRACARGREGVIDRTGRSPADQGDGLVGSPELRADRDASMCADRPESVAFRSDRSRPLALLARSPVTLALRRHLFRPRRDGQFVRAVRRGQCRTR